MGFFVLVKMNELRGGENMSMRKSDTEWSYIKARKSLEK